jgi:hypothetical protein
MVASLRTGSRRAVPLLAVIAAVGCAVFLLAACGGDDEEPQGTDLTEIRCPLAPTGEKVGGVEQFEPAEDSFNTADLVGMELEEAQSTAGEHGCNVMVSVEDGKGLPVPIEIDPTRIFVYTEDDVVTQIESVGGGL